MDVVPLKKKKKKVLKLPPEFTMLKGMDIEEYNKYMFPNNPLDPVFGEQVLEVELDRPFKLDFPPLPVGPVRDFNYYAPIAKVSRQVAESIRQTFSRSKVYRMECKQIKRGEAVDIKSLLFPFRRDYLVRRKGCGKMKAENLEGKYILVCCCYPPVLQNMCAELAVHACSDMYSKLEGNFEMVVVTQMRRGWTHPRARENDAFRHFFSAFPPSCLAVPLHARSRRHRICNYLGAANDPINPIILLVGPDGTALLHTELFCGMIDLQLVPLDVNGSDPTPFPFIARSLSSLKCPSSLEGFLLPFSDFVFRKKMMFSQQGGTSEPFVKEKVSLSDLNSKPVALYLFSDGEDLPLLRQIVQECRQTNKDLEVVVVSIDIDGTLQSFPETFSTVSAKRDLSWWVAPFNFSASIVLKHLFESQGDKVIIIGPNDLYVDVRGLQLMQIYGSFAYPFTFESVVQKTVEALRQITLGSLLKLLQIKEYPSTAKKVLFYFDFPHNISPSVNGQVYRFIKYDKVDLRFISLMGNEWFGSHVKNHKPEDSNPRDWTLKVSWNTRGADKIKNFFKRFFNHIFSTIVAFGEDGKICSLLAHDLPPSDGPEIKGNLVEEVSSILEKYLTDYDRERYFSEGNYDHNLASLQELRQSKFW